jgi:hypothetical protein
MDNPDDDDRARDHLASERTYLAWTRTGRATMGFGVVIAKLRFLFTAEALRAPDAGISMPRYRLCLYRRRPADRHAVGMALRDRPKTNPGEELS